MHHGHKANKSKNENPEKSQNVFLNSGIKNIGKSRDPRIWQNLVPKNPGTNILDPVRAWWAWVNFVHNLRCLLNKYTVNKIFMRPPVALVATNIMSAIK